MDFIQDLNESFDLKFEEVGETGDQTFILKYIDNDVDYRFYPEDTNKIINFLNNIDFFANSMKNLQ